MDGSAKARLTYLGTLQESESLWTVQWLICPQANCKHVSSLAHTAFPLF